MFFVMHSTWCNRMLFAHSALKQRLICIAAQTAGLDLTNQL